MNTTICRVGCAASISRTLLAPLALLPGLAAAAPLQISFSETRVPLFWPAGLGICLLLLTAVALALKLRLQRTTRESEEQAASLKADNNNLYRQLHSYGSELSAREKELGEARETIEQQRQAKADLLAIIGHHLREPLDGMHSTLNLLARSGGGDTAQLVGIAQRQLQGSLQSIDEILRLDELETVELQMPAPQSEAAKPGLSILLVESGEHDSLYTSLEIRGHHVQRETNGVDGADAALQHKFDLVLIDSKLPQMDGIEATEKIRRGSGRDLPIFAMVAGLSRGDKERYLARGLTGVLARPVAEHQLEQLLKWAAHHARKPAAGPRRQRPTRLVNTSTLSRQRDTLGHLSFAELLSDRCATLPKKTTALTSALTRRHWLDARQMAEAIAASADEIGLEAIAARLRALGSRLGIDSEREYCRHQRTELLNLMRASMQQLKAWREKNVHTEWALR